MDAKLFGEFLQSRRKELGFTQSDLAEKIHVTDKAISRWERGVGFPDIKLLEPLAEALELTLTELLKCEVMKKPLPETAAEETDRILEQQRTLSRKRKLMLWLGQCAILAAAFVLVLISHQSGLPTGLQFAAYTIGLLGTFFASLALRFIVEKTYLTGHPWGKWEKTHSWIVWILKTAGIMIVVFARRLLHSDNQLLLMLIGALLFGGGFLYEQLKKEQEEE